MSIAPPMRIFAALALAHSCAACSNLLIGAKASSTGSPQIAYTSDAGAWLLLASCL